MSTRPQFIKANPRGNRSGKDGLGPRLYYKGIRNYNARKRKEVVGMKIPILRNEDANCRI